MNTLYWGLGGIVLLVSITFLFTYLDLNRDVKWKKKINKIRHPEKSFDPLHKHIGRIDEVTGKFMPGSRIISPAKGSNTPVI